MKCQSCGYTAKDEEPEVCRLCGAVFEVPEAAADAPARRQTDKPKKSLEDRRNHVLVSTGSALQILEPETPFNLGRSKDCSLTIPSKRVSRNHAVIFWRSGFPVLKNMSEQNATLVNGRPVTEHELRESDEIQVGPFSCTYRCVKGDPKAVRQRFNSRSDTLVESAAAMEGSLADMHPDELLRMFEAQKKTGTLQLSSGDESGHIVIENGRCTSANKGTIRGQQAFFALVAWRTGTFTWVLGEVKKPAPLKIIRKFDYAAAGEKERDIKLIPISKLLDMAKKKKR